MVLDGLLQSTAATEAHIATQLEQWRGKLLEADSIQPPASVSGCSRAPPLARFGEMPFQRRCVIPDTEPMEQRWPPPRWPPGVPKPSSALAAYMPIARREVETCVRAIARWHATRMRGEDAARPDAGYWSDDARLPWLRGRVMGFWNGRCELLGAAGPAIQSRLNKDALLSCFATFPHRRLLSYCVHGVRLGDTLALDTVVAPNLLALLDVTGGADAVADELMTLKTRGWYLTVREAPRRSARARRASISGSLPRPLAACRVGRWSARTAGRLGVSRSRDILGWRRLPATRAPSCTR